MSDECVVEQPATALAVRDPFRLEVGADEVIRHAGWRLATEQAMASLMSGPGLTLLLGPSGCGKTLMLGELQRLLQAPGRLVRRLAASAFDPRSDPSIPDDAFVLIDDVRLNPGVLGALPTSGMFRCLLAELPSFHQHLSDLPRTPTSVRLDPLTPNQARGFVAARLAQAGQADDLLSPAALDLLVARAAGVARDLCVIGGQALRTAAAEGAHQISVEHIASGTGDATRALRPLVMTEQAPPSPTANPRRRPLLVAGAALAVVAAGTIGAAEMMRPPPARAVTEDPGSAAADPPISTVALAEVAEPAAAAAVPRMVPAPAPPPILAAAPAAAPPAVIPPAVIPPAVIPPAAIPPAAIPPAAIRPAAPAAVLSAEPPAVLTVTPGLPSPTPSISPPVEAQAPPAPAAPPDALAPDALAPDAVTSTAAGTAVGALTPATPTHLVIGYARRDHAGESRGTALAERLRRVGYVAADPVPMARGIDTARLKVFFAEDRAVGEQLRAALGPTAPATELVALPSRSSMPRPGTVELVLPADASVEAWERALDQAAAPGSGTASGPAPSDAIALTAPADNTTVAAGPTGRVALAWADPTGRRMRYFVEVAALDGPAPREVFAAYTRDGSIQVELDPNARQYAWRVHAIVRGTNHYDSSRWYRFNTASDGVVGN